MAGYEWHQSAFAGVNNPHSPAGAAALLLSRLPPWHAPVFTTLQWITDYNNWEQVEQLQKVGATTAAALGGARAWAPFAPHAQTLLRLPLDFSMARLPAAVAAAASLARLPRFAGLVRLPTMGSSFVRLPLVARRAVAERLRRSGAGQAVKNSSGEVAMKGGGGGDAGQGAANAVTNHLGKAMSLVSGRGATSNSGRPTHRKPNPHSLMVLPTRIFLRPARRLARSGARMLSRAQAARMQHQQLPQQHARSSHSHMLSPQQAHMKPNSRQTQHPPSQQPQHAQQAQHEGRSGMASAPWGGGADVGRVREGAAAHRMGFGGSVRPPASGGVLQPAAAVHTSQAASRGGTLRAGVGGVQRAAAGSGVLPALGGGASAAAPQAAATAPALSAATAATSGAAAGGAWGAGLPPSATTAAVAASAAAAAAGAPAVCHLHAQRRQRQQRGADVSATGGGIVGGGGGAGTADAAAPNAQAQPQVHSSTFSFARNAPAPASCLLASGGVATAGTLLPLPHSPNHQILQQQEQQQGLNSPTQQQQQQPQLPLQVGLLLGSLALLGKRVCRRPSGDNSTATSSQQLELQQQLQRVQPQPAHKQRCDEDGRCRSGGESRGGSSGGEGSGTDSSSSSRSTHRRQRKGGGAWAAWEELPPRLSVSSPAGIALLPVASRRHGGLMAVGSDAGGGEAGESSRGRGSVGRNGWVWGFKGAAGQGQQPRRHRSVGTPHHVGTSAVQEGTTQHGAGNAAAGATASAASAGATPHHMRAPSPPFSSPSLVAFPAKGSPTDGFLQLHPHQSSHPWVALGHVARALSAVAHQHASRCLL